MHVFCKNILTAVYDFIFRVENCRDAMVLAKDHLNIPRVISPEDFANPALDELSAMTYLSYFVKPNSPGYYATLNWVCKQLKTTTISNLTVNSIILRCNMKKVKLVVTRFSLLFVSLTPLNKVDIRYNGILFANNLQSVMHNLF